MKKQISILLFISSVLFSSCQNFPTVNVKTTFTQDFAVAKSGTTFNESKVIDATNDADFDKYKRKINSIDIERVTYTITSFNGPANQILQNGTLNVTDESGSTPVNIATFSNLNLSDAVGKETDIEASSAGLSLLQNLLRKDPFKAVVSYSGKVNQGPINLNISLKFYSTLKARVVGSN